MVIYREIKICDILVNESSFPNQFDLLLIISDGEERNVVLKGNLFDMELFEIANSTNLVLEKKYELFHREINKRIDSYLDFKNKKFRNG